MVDGKASTFAELLFVLSSLTLRIEEFLMISQMWQNMFKKRVSYPLIQKVTVNQENLMNFLAYTF